jgi:hypothetical protein
MSNVIINYNVPFRSVASELQKQEEARTYENQNKTALEDLAKTIISLFESNRPVNPPIKEDDSLERLLQEAKALNITYSPRAKDSFDKITLVTLIVQKRLSKIKQQSMIDLRRSVITLCNIQPHSVSSRHPQDYTQQSLKLILNKIDSLCKFYSKEDILQLSKVLAQALTSPRPGNLDHNQLLILKNRDTLLCRSTLVEIAKIAAAKNGHMTSEHIKEYGITDPNTLLEIARIAAVENGTGISEHIKKYDITEQSARIEIAMIAAVQYIPAVQHDDDEANDTFDSFSQFIDCYEIKDQNALIKIALITAARDGVEISKHIKKYGITDQKELIRIAKDAFRQNARAIKWIKEYGIKDPNALIEIAKIAAAQNGGGTSEHIRKYNITDQQALIEIAKIAAAQNGGGTSEHIREYNITDQQALIEIAKIAAAQNGGGTSVWIKNYGIKDPNALIEIAKIAAAQDGSGTSLWICRYEIKDQNTLIEIARIAVGQNARGAIEHLRLYDIKDGKILFEIFLEALIHHRGAPISPNAYSFPDEFCPETALSSLEPLVGAQACSIQLLTKLVNNLDRKIRQKALIWLTHFLGNCLEMSLNSDQFALLLADKGAQNESKKDSSFIGKTLDYRDPHFRYRLTEAMITFAKDDKAKSFAAAHPKVNTQGKLPLLLLSILHAQGVSKHTCDQLVPIANHRDFRDSNNKYLKTYMNALMLILENKDLLSQDKEQLLLKIIEKDKQTGGESSAISKPKNISPKFINQLRLATAIFDMGAVNQLKEEVLKKDALSDILQVLFQRQLPIKLIDDFTNRYSKNFAEARIPHYICVYIAAIQPLIKTDETFRNTLACCIEAILEETLKQKRYDLAASSHLQTVFLGRNPLLEAWKIGETSLLNQSDTKYGNWTLEDTDDAQDLFLCGTEVDSCQRITNAGDLNICLLAYVLDGKNRLLAIKDSTGKIMARGILRMLWSNKKPVLFLERLYPVRISDVLTKALETFAKQRASKLGLPLFSKEVGIGSPYNFPLVSLGSLAPFEYCDSLFGMTNGTYTISGAHQLQ